ncbi:MAG TPA: AAA family ATPase [Planctomycetota bacterium]|nr:AAA family ATPase [Planctomycetota bacterium]HRR80399.1 AAA family ATPase [Planctomycetota bacterium]HRT95378.1 AAA family ATPase [Planctomycetota bacterium]
MACVASIINLKGGVGKTTLTMMIAEFLVFRAFKRVLLIDMDAQANLTYCMVPSNSIQQQRESERTLYHLLQRALRNDPVSIPDFITQPPLVVSNIQRSSLVGPHYPGVLHMIVSVPDVAELDEELVQLWEGGRPMPGGVRHCLREALEPVRNQYDYVILDCPPGLSLFSSTSLVASDIFISPVIPEPLSLQGVDLVQKRAGELNRRHGARVDFGGIVLNVVKHYRTTHRMTSQRLYSDEGQGTYRPFRWWIPDNERLRKLGDFDPDLYDEVSRTDQFSPKFRSIENKYGVPYTLTNPKDGPLNRGDEEGEHYRLHERLDRVVDEFQRRCGLSQ